MLQLTQLSTVPKLSDTSMTYEECLKVGEYWEDALVTYLLSQGLEAYRQNQTFKNPYDYPRFQRDVTLWDLSENSYNVEVKSRRNPFGYASIDVGKCRSWDVKDFQVHYLVVIDQATGLAAVATGDRSQWLRRKNLDLCYSIPRHLFTPLEPWVDFIKTA